jgi:hypothetical protein
VPKFSKSRYPKNKLAIFLLIFLGTPAWCSELNFQKLVAERGPRDVIWSFDASLTNPTYTCPDGSKITGYGGSFSVGYGRFHDSHWYSGRMHFLAGPFDVARDNQFDADFNGTIIDFEYGTAFPGFSLRSDSAPVLSISGGYMDYNGHNIGENRKNDGDPNNSKNYYLEQDFKSSTGAIIVTPSVGWIWPKPPRPRGNEPELLLTRVEAAFLKLGAQIPLYSHSRMEVVKRDENDSISQNASKRTSTGLLAGYSLILSTGVMLGI